MRKHSINRWIVLIFTVILLLSLFLSTIVTFRTAITSAMKHGMERSKTMSFIITNLIRHQWGDLEGLSLSNSRKYSNARNTLSQLCIAFQMDVMFVYTIDPETSTRFIYIAAAADPQEDEEYQKMVLSPKKIS